MKDEESETEDAQRGHVSAVLALKNTTHIKGLHIAKFVEPHLLLLGVNRTFLHNPSRKLGWNTKSGLWLSDSHL